MAENNNEAGGLVIDCTPSGRNGTATLTARLNGEPIHVEKLDVTKPKAREAFTAALCEGRPGIDRAAVAAELLRIAAKLVNPEPTEADTVQASRPDVAALLGQTPEPVKAAARTLLESPKLIETVVADIGRLGVAGEKELGATLYLVGVSRLLPHPLAVIVQGPSSSGKSYVVSRVAALYPPEGVLVATQLTPMALFYMEPGSLVHRWVIVGERSRAEDDETADATRALREMLSEGRLSKLVPVKQEGQQRTVLIEQEGPIAYVETTTLNRIFEEDANRCILLNTDERPDQTRRILTATAAAYGGGAAADTQGIIDRHHALQRLLQPSPVIVPFAERLADAIDHHRVESRRAFPHLLAMVQASALLHQRQRLVDGDGRLVADADDYRLARHLLAGPMARQLGGRISEPAARFLERLRGWYGAGGEFSKPEAKRRETGSQSAVYGWVGELVAAGLVEQVEEQRGRTAGRFRLGKDAPDPDAAAVLPPIEKVFPAK